MVTSWLSRRFEMFHRHTPDNRNYTARFRCDQDLYVHHHLGLGDMIHCNGMVRVLLDRLDADKCIHVFCKHRYFEMVRWMYRDEHRIIIESIDELKNEGSEVARRLRLRKSSNLLKVGHRALRDLEYRYPHLFFDQLFYLQLKIPYDVRFTHCHWVRELEEEKRVFKKLAPKGTYAFVHDDPARGYTVDTASIALPIVRNDASESIFHLGMLLENATEVHCMESSIRCMSESLNLCQTKLVYHNFRYPGRPLGSATQLPWTQIDYLKAA
jgi:hypothetical protein